MWVQMNHFLAGSLGTEVELDFSAVSCCGEDLMRLHKKILNPQPGAKERFSSWQ